MSPTAARQIVRLPEGNQTEVLEVIRRETLTTAELAGVVDLWFGCAAEQRQQEYLLRHPRETLSQAKGTLLAGQRKVARRPKEGCSQAKGTLPTAHV